MLMFSAFITTPKSNSYNVGFLKEVAAKPR